MTAKRVAKSKKVFLPADKDRLLVILALTVFYPVLVASLFVLFLFWILPIALTPAGAAPAVMSPGYWLHGYWLVAAALWLLLMAIILPLMTNDRPPPGGPGKAVSYKRESGVSIRDEHELTPQGDDKDDGLKLVAVGAAAAAAGAGGALLACKYVSVSNKSLKGDSDSDSGSLSHDDLVTVVETVQADDRGSHDKLNKSSGSLAERQKLTQSGEFLNDCLAPLKSDDEEEEDEDDIEGEIIRGNTNCEVHAQTLLADDADSTSEVALLDPPTKQDSDSDSCKEPLHERVERDSIRKPSQYAEIEKTALLQEQECGAVTEAVNEAIDEADSDDQRTGPLQQGVVCSTGDSSPPAVEDMVQPVLRPKSKALPSLDMSRASQVHCSAPSTLSPRESNVVFLYVNPTDETQQAQ